jgi:hypothetical protein
VKAGGDVSPVADRKVKDDIQKKELLNLLQ